jgi:hypothetical protein
LTLEKIWYLSLIFSESLYTSCVTVALIVFEVFGPLYDHKNKA